MGTLRKIQRKQQRPDLVQASELLTEEQRRLPSARVVTTPVKGVFVSLPVLGWCSMRADDVPVVMVAVILLKDEGFGGMVHLELPIYVGETDKATVAALDRYGWDGRTWGPGQAGWPLGDDAAEGQLRKLIADSNLVQSLTFPPSGEEGYRTQAIDVTRARGSFLLPPLPEPKEPVDETKLQFLLELCRNSARFYRSN